VVLGAPAAGRPGPRAAGAATTPGVATTPGAATAAAKARVVVPRVTGTDDLISAYSRLHRAGLRMAIPQPFSLRSLCLPTARTQTPAAGTHVARWSTVTVHELTCFLGSPSGGYQRAAVVPDFRGRPASSAVAWAGRNQLYWELDRLPALRSSSRAELLDNYVVTAEAPQAGSLLARGTSCPGVTSTGCFQPTPLVMRGRARR
jgi:hypothetical protein